MHRHICLYTYLDVFSKVKIGLMWASEQCYGEIMRSAQSLGLCVDNFTENLNAAEGLRPSATTPCEVGRQPLSAEIRDSGGHQSSGSLQ